MKWFVRGDIDGFFGLALDNLVQMLLIVGLCTKVVGLPDAIVFGRILPGAAVSLLVGNLFYAWQAKKLAERTGRTDVCALPYGINTVSLFAFIFLVMLPVKYAALGDGRTPAEAAEFAWQAGIVACLGSGIIELAGAWCAEWIRKATPRAALLSTLAGIALGFISFTFLFRTYAHPLVGFSTLAVILIIYFGRVRFIGRIPGGLVALLIGTAIAWLTGPTGIAEALGLAPTVSTALPEVAAGFYPPIPVIGDLFDGMKYMMPYITIIIPMGVFSVVGSLQNIESAEAAGDLYPTAPALAMDGVGTLAAALFGSCFPTTIYIGHPGWKGLGARAGYSVLNAIFFTVVCLTGTMAWVCWLVPVEAGMAIVIWIGLVITVQAFDATPKAHTPAVVLGLLPAIGAWGVLMLKNGMRIALDVHGQHPGAYPWQDHVTELSGAFDRVIDFPGAATGLFGMEQGFIFTAMIIAAVTVAVIGRRYLTAAAWCGAAAALTAVGFMHTFLFSAGDVVGNLGGYHQALPWVIGYLLMAGVFVAAKYLTRPVDEPVHL